MARPCKSAKVQADRSLNKDELNIRTETEKTLQGAKNKIVPPSYLDKNQKKIFKYIVSELKAADILGNLDVYILATCSIAIDRLQMIESKINQDIELVQDKELMSAKDKYTKDLYRCCNELSLSPQSRAKMANINLQAKDENPLIKALLEDDSE